MRVMVVTRLLHVGFSVSARKMCYILEKCSKMRVLRFLKSGPSVKIRFGFWGFSRITWSKNKIEMIITPRELKILKNRREVDYVSICDSRMAKNYENIEAEASVSRIH